MVWALLYVFLALLSCFAPAVAVKTMPPGNGVVATGHGDTSAAGTEYVEANCGRLTVRGGLKVNETVKVTFTGWSPEDHDLIVTLVTDETSSSAMAKQSTASLASGGSGGVAVNSGEDQLPETPAVPVVGVRIPGKSGEDLSDSDLRLPAVLLFKGTSGNPTVIPLNSAAGPTRPVMIFFTQVSLTDQRITVYTWLSQATQDGSPGGSWEAASLTVGVGLSTQDIQVVTNDTYPKNYRVYGPKTAQLYTAAEGKCSVTEPQVVLIGPSS